MCVCVCACVRVYVCLCASHALQVSPATNAHLDREVLEPGVRAIEQLLLVRIHQQRHAQRLRR
jgi:hypothetical protein